MEIILTQPDIDILIKHYYKGVKKITYKGKKVILEVDNAPQFIEARPINRQPPPPSSSEHIPEPSKEQNVMKAGGERERNIAFIG